MNKGGLCESCLSPGACCREVVLSGGSPMGYFQDVGMSEEKALELAKQHNLPFVPLREGADGVWRWRCTALDEGTGRCTIYENRPYLCADYREGSDGLCVHHWKEGD